MRVFHIRICKNQKRSSTPIFPLACWIFFTRERVVTWHRPSSGPRNLRDLLLSYFLAVHDVELVAGTKDDRPFRHFPGFQFIDVWGRVAFGSRLGNVEILQVDDYGLVIAELTKHWLLRVRSPI